MLTKTFTALALICALAFGHADAASTTQSLNSPQYAQGSIRIYQNRLDAQARCLGCKTVRVQLLKPRVQVVGGSVFSQAKAEIIRPVIGSKNLELQELAPTNPDVLKEYLLFLQINPRMEVNSYLNISGLAPKCLNPNDVSCAELDTKGHLTPLLKDVFNLSPQ